MNKSNIKYDEKIAKRYQDKRYYESNEELIKRTEFMQNESKRFATKKKDIVSQKIDKHRNYKSARVFEKIQEIFNKNIRAAFFNEEIKNVHLINIVSDIRLLALSYIKLKKNKGSMSEGADKSKSEYEKLDEEQKNLINKLERNLDGISLEVIKATSKALKKGKYPWGTSKRIYVDKPGRPGQKRPITIPPFMDKIVQEAIRHILVAIYEPYFDKMNVSFGFRPGKSVHDAIYMLTNNKAQGMTHALEADVKAAYDRVNKKKLIEILEKKITDKKFIKLIEERLNYEFYDTEKQVYVMDDTGIPQGGPDSPYLWNIYMLEFDIFVQTELQNFIEDINIKTRGENSEGKKIINNERDKASRNKHTLSKILTWIHHEKKTKGTFKNELMLLKKTNVKDWHKISNIFPKKLNGAKTFLEECEVEKNDEKTIRDILQRKIKRLMHTMNNMPHLNENKKYLRFIYSRYCDDWIILTNMKESLLKIIKHKAKEFLEKELYTELSEEKTLITDIRKTPARFLGFEIKTYRSNKIGKIIQTIKGKRKKIVAKIAGKRVFALIDKQRLIDRLHMKGYCQENGFPREMTRLNNLEPFTIIDRTNSVLLGLANYYANTVRMPKSELSRWVYIIRYSCLKTLALKFKTSIKEVFEKFKPKVYNQKESRTIEDTVVIKVDNKKYEKSWKLFTLQYLLNKSRDKKAQLAKKEMEIKHYLLNGGEPPKYEEKSEGVKINKLNYLERANWVNIRTQASFDLQCCICGSTENIEMHHIRHVRKTRYSNINKQKTWQQVMGIKNRKQIPVCRFCHKNIIHKGLYSGTSLQEMTITKMYDNRIVTSGNYIHKGDPKKNYRKTLYEKGWTLIQNKDTGSELE